MQELTIRERVRAANRIIDAIAESGPCNLYSPVSDRKARFGLDRVGQVWYVDHFTGMRLYPSPNASWLGFTGSDNLRRLVEALGAFIRESAPLDVDKIVALLDGYSAKDRAEVRATALLANVAKK